MTQGNSHWLKIPKIDNLKSCNSLKPVFTNVEGLCCNFVGCQSFFNVLALCKTTIDDSFDSISCHEMSVNILTFWPSFPSTQIKRG